MKINFQVLSLLVFVSILSACSKNGGVSPKNTDNTAATTTTTTTTTSKDTTTTKKDTTTSTTAPTKLKYLTQDVFDLETSGGVVNPSSFITTSFAYDDKKRLIDIKNTSSEDTFVYNVDGSLASETSLSKSGATVFKFDYELTYTSGKLSLVNVTGYANDAITIQNAFNYIYTGANITEVDASGSDGKHVTTYYYDSNNNVSKSVQDDVLIEPFTYDNKKSRYSNMPQALKNIYMGTDFVSPNNALTDGSIVYTYTYDSDGYPLSRSFVSAGTVYKDTYSYTEL